MERDHAAGPEKLREWSRQLREAARKTTDDTAKRRLANDALILGQLAEALAILRVTP